MPAQNHNQPFFFSRQSFQFFAEIQFFAGEQFIAETADGSKRGCFAKNKSARRPVRDPADAIPEFGHDACSEVGVVQAQGAATGDRFTLFDFADDIRKKFRAGLRIRIDEHQPFAGRGGGTAISRARDLVDRLKHNFRSVGPRDFGGLIRGIVIANYYFCLPTEPMKCGRSQVYPLQRFPDQLFFVECGNHDGNFHC